MTAQSERMLIMADLLDQADQIKNELTISVQRSGHREENSPAMARYQAFNIIADETGYAFAGVYAGSDVASDKQACLTSRVSYEDT